MKKIGICIININPTRIQKYLLFVITTPFPAPAFRRQERTAIVTENDEYILK